MKTLLQILKERKLQLFFLLYVLMPVPVLSLLAQNLSLSAVAVGIGLSLLLLCVVFLLASFMTTRGLKIFYSLLLAVTIIPGTILIGYLFIGHVLLSGGTITSIFDTNTDEASEFIAYLNPWLVTAVTLFVLTPIVMICRMKQPERFFRIRRHKYAFFALVFVALLFVTVRPVAQRIYFVDFYRVFAHYKIGRFREERALAGRHTLSFEVRTLPDKTPRLVVLVIGESHARRHMSLYGYPRDTNPLLSARRGELSVYTELVSPQSCTIPAFRAHLRRLGPPRTPHHLPLAHRALQPCRIRDVRHQQSAPARRLVQLRRLPEAGRSHRRPLRPQGPRRHPPAALRASPDRPQRSPETDRATPHGLSHRA